MISPTTLPVSRNWRAIFRTVPQANIMRGLESIVLMMTLVLHRPATTTEHLCKGKLFAAALLYIVQALCGYALFKC